MGNLITSLDRLHDFRLYLRQNPLDFEGINKAYGTNNHMIVKKAFILELSSDANSS
jgi:hypothetical protein